MERQQLKDFKAWFQRYAADFYKTDVFVNANLKLKEEHTHRVCDEICYLTEKLNLGESERLMAQTVALFHDLGRYRQFTKYRTFSDARSIPHGPLAVEVLRRHNVLDCLDQREKTIIEESIKLHAVKELPPDMDNDILLLARLIRDADKLDIYHLVTEVDNKPQDESDGVLMINWFPKGGDCSEEIIRAVLNKEHIDYKMLKTNNDMKIMQLVWVYDLNFQPTFEKVKHKRHIEKIIDMLPRTKDITRVAEQVLAYVDQRSRRIQ